jgi:hypothetical protein
MASDETFFKDQITAHIESQLKANKDIGGSGLKDEELIAFLTSLTKTYGIDYSEFSPFINGNYAVFMEHGTWWKILKDYMPNMNKPEPSAIATIKNYISIMNDSKSDINLNNYDMYGDKFQNFLKFGQTITDISLPEPNKEYMAISTRQKNSFVNTRDYVGSDFSMSFIDTKELGIFKYMEAWNKSIDLIREGLFLDSVSDTAKDFLSALSQEDYLIDNLYNNTIWIALLDSKGVDLRGIIALFGVMPMNMPFKNLIGDRGSPKAVTYNLNFKFMDMQYTFVDGWDKLQTSDNNNQDVTLSKKFFNYLSYSGLSGVTNQ